MSAPACSNAPCSNRGNAAKGGRCNSCTSGKPPTLPSTTICQAELPYAPDIQALVDATSGARIAALQDIDSFPHMHCIHPWLYIGDECAAGILTPLAMREGGSAANAPALAQLQAHRITAVVCVSGAGASHRPFEAQGIAYANAMLSDGSEATKRASEALFPVLLQGAVPLVRRAREAGSAVLVHCNAGINRSCSTACAILMALTPGLTLAQAYAQVVAARPVCQPSFHSYLSSPAFAALAAHLHSAPPQPSALQAASAAVWSLPAPWLPPHPPRPSTLAQRRDALDSATFKNPLLGLALLLHSGQSLSWEGVHFFDDSASNCASARSLLPAFNVHEVEQGEGQGASLQRQLQELLSLPRPGLLCLDWGGTLEGAMGTLCGGEATAALLRRLCAAGWTLACVSNDPNEALVGYSAVLAGAGAPPFAILANGERIHQVRLGAALGGVGGSGGSLERVAGALQSELSAPAPSASSGSGSGSGSTQQELALLEWAYYYAQRLPASFHSTLQLERGEAVTAAKLGSPALPADLAAAVAALQQAPIPGLPPLD